MSILQNRKIGLRLGIGIGVRLVLLLLVAGTAYYRLNGAGDYRLVARSTPTAGVRDSDLLTVQVQVKNSQAKDSPEAAKTALDSVESLRAEYAKGVDLFKGRADAQAVSTVDDRART